MAEFEWNQILWLNQILVGGRMRAELEREGLDFAVKASDATPVDTGLMKSSWKTDVDVDGDRLKATVYNNATKTMFMWKRFRVTNVYPLYVEYAKTIRGKPNKNQGFLRRLVDRQGL